MTSLLAGCATQATPAAVPTARTTTPTPNPTAVVGFGVNVTAVAPSNRHHKKTSRHHGAKASPPASGPYLMLSPASGPPTTRTITVRGGHLPPSSPVSLIWTAGRAQPISSLVFTGRKGSLNTKFTVPGSQSGNYRIVAEINGTPYASAVYSVISKATLTASTAPRADAVWVSVHGKHFLPHIQLALSAYPLQGRAKPIVFAHVETNRHGAFTWSGAKRRLADGQYLLRAWSIEAGSAQTATQVFEVVG